MTNVEIRPQRVTVWQVAHGAPIYRATCNRCGWAPKINYESLSQAQSANARHRRSSKACTI